MPVLLNEDGKVEDFDDEDEWKKRLDEFACTVREGRGKDAQELTFLSVNPDGFLGISDQYRKNFCDMLRIDASVECVPKKSGDNRQRMESDGQVCPFGTPRLNEEEHEKMLMTLLIQPNQERALHVLAALAKKEDGCMLENELIAQKILSRNALLGTVSFLKSSQLVTAGGFGYLILSKGRRILKLALIEKGRIERKVSETKVRNIFFSTWEKKFAALTKKIKRENKYPRSGDNGKLPQLVSERCMQLLRKVSSDTPPEDVEEKLLNEIRDIITGGGE
jgi:hypothetical protein